MNYEFRFLPENPKGECAAIGSRPEAQAHSGYGAGQ